MSWWSVTSHVVIFWGAATNVVWFQSLQPFLGSKRLLQNLEMQFLFPNNEFQPVCAKECKQRQPWRNTPSYANSPVEVATCIPNRRQQWRFLHDGSKHSHRPPLRPQEQACCEFQTKGALSFRCGILRSWRAVKQTGILWCSAIVTIV